MPLVSIIIPSFNNLQLLRKCIDSINNQSFTDYDVFVKDAGSIDGTIEYLQSLNEPFSWISEPDQGVYDAMNKGIDLSKGEWLYFLGADDFLYNDKVLEEIFSNKIADDVSLIIGNVQYDYSSADSILIKNNSGLFKPSWSNTLWLKNTLHHQGVFYRSNLFKTRKYNSNYKVLADYDFNLELFKDNKKVLILDRTIAVSKTEGISKNYNWQLYKEEIELKSRQSSFVFKPIFFIMGLVKYLLKKIM